MSDSPVKIGFQSRDRDSTFRRNCVLYDLALPSLFQSRDRDSTFRRDSGTMTILRVFCRFSPVIGIQHSEGEG